jgi:hypothetical protein
MRKNGVMICVKYVLHFQILGLLQVIESEGGNKKILLQVIESEGGNKKLLVRGGNAT